MSIEPITRLQRFLRVLADSSADMPEPLRNLEKCCCYACGHLDTRPELHTTLEKLIASVRDKSIVPPKPNTRLEKYVAAMAGVWDDELPEPITREDKILFEAASGEDVTLSGNPLILENCIGGKALKALHVYGKSTQDGTPTPDAPVPIVSVGDGGNVTVKVTGKNLLHLPDVSGTDRGVTVTVKNGLISISGTATETGYVSIPIPPFIIPGVAILSSSLTSPKASLVTKTYRAVLYQNVATKMSDTAARLTFTVKQGQTYNLTGVKVQLELGTTATAYEPYREQLLTLPTPNGLPGIPVTSGGNYTDSTGQQWVCDEIDLERRVKVQRIASFVIDAKNANDISVMNPYANVNVVTSARLRTPQKTSSKDRNDRCVFCEALPWMYNTWSSTVNAVNYVEDNRIDFAIENSYLGLSEASTDDERKTALVKYFTDKPCRVVYRIATPVETPLTPAEIAAYKSLTTYAPTTGLQATDGAGLEATYKCNVRKAEKTINDLYAKLTAELEA